jgi:hypothetical protein
MVRAKERVNAFKGLNRSLRLRENETMQEEDEGVCFPSTLTSNRHQGRNDSHVAFSFLVELCDNGFGSFYDDLAIHSILGT